MAMQGPESSSAPPTLLELIGNLGHVAAPEVQDFVQLGAAAQSERRRRHQSDVDELTRTTSLWAVLHLDDAVARTLEPARVTEAGLARLMSLGEVPEPASVRDVSVHPELERALRTELTGATKMRRTVGLVDIAIAALRDAQENGGLLHTRLKDMGADIDGSVTALERVRSGESVLEGAPPSSYEKVSPPPPLMPQPHGADIPQRAEAPVDREPLSDTTRLFLGIYEALRDPSESRTADPEETINGRAMWAAFGLVHARQRGTLASVLVATMLRLTGDRTSLRSATAGLRAFDLADDVEPVPFANIDVATHPLLARARAIRDRVEPNEPIHLRHLVAVAIEEGTGPRGPETRDEDLESIRSDFLAQIGTDAPPEVAAAWTAHFAQVAEDGLAATAPAPRPPSGRAFAGLDVDMVDDDTALSDELRVVDDVVTLCNVLAARAAVPPISVGLFGRWGSGKSYFMALMRRRIDEIRQVARAADARHEETSYCTEVVQITFNAWHYMDTDDFWATLAVHLFGAVAQVDPDDDRARPRADVVRELEEREREMATIDRKITRALGDERLDDAAARMGLESHRKSVLGLVTEVGTTISYAAAGKVLLTETRWTKKRRWSVVALLSILAALAAVGILIATGNVEVGWVVAWLPAMAAAVGTATKWLRAIKDGLAQVNRVVADSGLEPRDLTAERIDKDARIRELRAELEAIDRSAAGRDWFLKRAQSTDYTSHFGVISVLRGDLEAMVVKQRRETPNRRIILYIDDLDRCEPTRVVEVLQAVHLLLAFPLFVVVVGVDPRWLLRSLERHYRKVLSTPDGSHRDDDIPETTPHDYLEKIFQVPFSLRPMGSDAYGRLVASMTGPGVGASTLLSGDGVGTTDVAVEDESGPEPAVTETDEPRSAGASAAANGPAGAGIVAGTATPPDDQTAAAIPAEPALLAPVSVNPPKLQITADEVDALARMGPLIGTPRAAKRLVNLYRVIRAGLPDAEVASFVADARFQPLVIVLATQVGFAQVSSAFLACLVGGAEDGDTITGRIAFGPPSERAEQEGEQWESLRAALRAVCVDDDGEPVEAFDRPVSELREWIPRLRRYSFEGALATR